MAIGKSPQLSLSQARALNAENRRMLAAGIDPMARRKTEKTVESQQIENAFETIAHPFSPNQK